MGQAQSSEGVQPGREPLYVPVRSGAEWIVVRMYRTALGERTAVAFTSLERLTATLGIDQPWTRLGRPALQEVAAAQGVTILTLDPTLTAPRPLPLHPLRDGQALGWNVPLEVRA